MKVGILGTRGIPNHYGGFEQFAEYLSLGLVKRGIEVVVYNSSTHPYQEPSWNGVTIVHCKDLEDRIGSAGQFVYDFNCILDARKQNFDVLLQLGYTSNSVWKGFLPSEAIIVTNMDGLEWKRTKYNKLVQGFLRKAEKWAVESSHHLIADSKAIQSYLKQEHKVDSTFIAYGAHLFEEPNERSLLDYEVVPFQYLMLIARMEPENNIEVILDGYVASSSTMPFLVVGKTDNLFGSYLIEKFKEHRNIKFIGGVYDLEVLNNLRHFSKFYFHGHSVGGTNPSLLEAMASSACIIANDNEFNRAILEEDARYFSNAKEVAAAIDSPELEADRSKKIENNRRKIKNYYSWDVIIKAYEDLFRKLAAPKPD